MSLRVWMQRFAITKQAHRNDFIFGEKKEREREMFYLTTHSTHFIYGYMASSTWLRTILIVRKETRCRHIGYSYRLTAIVLLYAPSHRQDNTYHGLCYTSRRAQAGTRYSSMGPPHEGSIRRPIAPWANALPLSYVSLPGKKKDITNGGHVYATPTPSPGFYGPVKRLSYDYDAVMHPSGESDCLMPGRFESSVIFFFHKNVLSGSLNNK